MAATRRSGRRGGGQYALAGAVALGVVALAAAILILQDEDGPRDDLLASGRSASVAPSPAGSGQGGSVASAQPPTDPPPAPTQAPQPTVAYDGLGASSDQRIVTELDRSRLYVSLDPDDIRPIYQPRFVPATEVSMADGGYVIGLAINGEAKAYPVDILNFREMVNDVVGGVPVLVTW